MPPPTPPPFPRKAPIVHTHPQADVVGLIAALAGKADDGHGHGQVDVAGLVSTLAGKAPVVHEHAIADVTGLQDALDAAGGGGGGPHDHPISGVTGLQTALDGKAPVAHTHAQADVTGLVAALSGKEATGVAAAAVSAHEAASDPHPGYALESDPRLSDARAPTAHTHAIADVTSLQGALDAKALSTDPRFTDARAPTAHTQATSTVTFAATDKLLGRSTAGAGAGEEIACTAAGRALLDDADAGAQRATLGLGALAVKATVATADVDVNAITYARIQDVTATQRVLGRNTAGAGDPEEVTATQVLDWLGSAAQGAIAFRGTAGWVLLAPGVSGEFLKTQGAAADPVWATPAGGAGGDFALTKRTASASATVTAGSSAYVSGPYEIGSGFTIEIANNAVLEIG